MKKMLLFVMILVLVMTMFVACAKKAQSGGSVTITVSTFSGDPYQSSWRNMFDKFQADNGITIIQDAVPWESLGDKQILEIASGSGTYDVVYVHPFWFENLVSNGYLLPIDDYCDASERGKFIESLLSLYEYKGKVYGLPDWITTQIVGYRKDLFQQAGLSAPKSWDDILNAATKLADGDNLYGITIPGRASGPLSGVYMAALLSNGGWFTDRNGNPTANSPAAIETGEFLLKLSKLAPTGYQNFHWEQNAEVANSGKAAIILCMTSNVNWLEDPTRSRTRGQWAYVPFSNKTNGGMIDSYCWSVVKGTKNLDAAAKLVKFIADTEVQMYLTEHMGTAGATHSYYANPELLASYPQLTAMNLAFENTAPQPSWATWGSEQNILENGLQDVFNGRATVKEVLDALQAKMIENR